MNFEEKAREWAEALPDDEYETGPQWSLTTAELASFGRLCAVEVAERAVLRARLEGIAESPREVVRAVVAEMEKEAKP